ncbi:TPA: hypothetical protein EYP66_19155 [Candidatus Poribacteria bacterium]|nr:hypothetical protein [Candidatus Poribacteria bacterium]
MTAKKITGKSKLAKAVETNDDTREHLDLVTPNKKAKLKAYRLYDDDISRLKKITATMNRESHRHISETAAIRALLVLGSNATGERLLNALRKTI